MCTSLSRVEEEEEEQEEQEQVEDEDKERENVVFLLLVVVRKGFYGNEERNRSIRDVSRREQCVHHVERSCAHLSRV